MKCDICELGEKQRIVLMNGGLGNQVFQYFFLRWMELLTEEPCLASDQEFCVEKPAHNGYEMERVFGIQVNRLSRKISSYQWQDMMWRYENNKESICQQLYDMGYPVTMVAESSDFRFNGPVVCMGQYDPAWRNKEGFFYFHGYWIHNYWFRDLEKVFLMELKFPPIQDEANKKYEAEIRGCKSACLHVRRGDFVKLGYAIPGQAYLPLVKELSKREANLTWFVFSDDIPWCRKNARKLGLAGKEIVFVEGNKGGERLY